MKESDAKLQNEYCSMRRKPIRTTRLIQNFSTYTHTDTTIYLYDTT